MENKKTISYLNSKVWYRFSKVAFITVFIIVFGVFNFIAFSGGVKKVDQNKTTIQCNLGLGKNTSFTPASIDLSLSISDFNNGQFNYKSFYEGYNDFQIEKILTACYPKRDTTTDIYDDQKEAEIALKDGVFNADLTINGDISQEQKNIFGDDYKAYKQQTGGLFGDAKLSYLDFSVKSFDIKPTYTYNGFLELFLIGNFVILLIFEAVRRAFYYIVLGSLRPAK